MDCPICLEPINENDKKKLSCNHTFHAKCYYNCVAMNNYNSFIKCPLCREINVDPSLPYKEPLQNLKLFHVQKRCSARTKEGKRCKCKNTLFSRYCHIHEKNPIKKEEHAFVAEYIEWLFMTSSTTRTKISMIHLLKHLMNRNDTIEKNITKLHYYYFRYYRWALENETSSSTAPSSTIFVNDFCDYYDIEDLDYEWLTMCKDSYKLFI